MSFTNIHVFHGPTALVG